MNAPRPVATLLPLALAALAFAWARFDVRPFPWLDPRGADPQPVEWIEFQRALIGFPHLQEAVGDISIVLALLWTAVLTLRGWGRTERDLRELVGLRVPMTRGAAARAALVAAAAFGLVRTWTYRHYMQIPLQIEGKDSWTLYACGVALRSGANPYTDCPNVGAYAYLPWVLAAMAPMLPASDDAAMQAAQDPALDDLVPDTYIAWRARWWLLRTMALPAVGAGLLLLVNPSRRGRATILLVPLLLGHHEIAKDFRQGQITILLLAALLGWSVCMERGAHATGGILAGLTFPAKLFTSFLLPYALWVRERRAAAWMAVAAAAGVILPLLLYDTRITDDALRVIRATGEGLYRADPPYEHNQSLMMGISRLLQPAVDTGRLSLDGRERLLRVAAPCILVWGVAILAAGIPRRPPRDGEERMMDLGAILTVCLLVFPQVHSYQFSLHVVPVVAIACAFWRRGAGAGPWTALVAAWFLASFQGYARYEIHLPDPCFDLTPRERMLQPWVLWIGPLRDLTGRNFGILANLVTLALWAKERRRGDR